MSEPNLLRISRRTRRWLGELNHLSLMVNQLVIDDLSERKGNDFTPQVSHLVEVLTQIIDQIRMKSEENIQVPDSTSSDDPDR